jgi:hypothetical protein
MTGVLRSLYPHFAGVREAPSAPGMGHGSTSSPHGSRPTSSHASRTTSSPSATSTHSTKRPAGSDEARSTWALWSCSRRPACRVKCEVDASANSKAPHAISHDGQRHCGGCRAVCTQQLSEPKTVAPRFVAPAIRRSPSEPIDPENQYSRGRRAGEFIVRHPRSKWKTLSRSLHKHVRYHQRNELLSWLQ